MLTVRPAGQRGRSDLGWLQSYHTFSFADYHDPAHSGFRALRVLNDDVVAPARGFGAHGHRDMEILSYVLTGTLAHKDSLAEARTVGPNEVQVLSAGSGVIHSEFNPSPTEPVHFFQIWIEPAVTDATPSYQQFAYEPSEKRGRLRLIAGPDAKNTLQSAAVIHQDARVYAAVLGPGESISHAIAPGRHAWVQCALGTIVVNGISMQAGDGVAASDKSALALRGTGPGDSELLLFDLA